MKDYVPEIEEIGRNLASWFVRKGRKLTKRERYTILKLAELCISISRESAKDGETRKIITNEEA